MAPDGPIPAVQSANTNAITRLQVKNTFVHLSPEKTKSLISSPPRTVPSNFWASQRAGGTAVASSGGCLFGGIPAQVPTTPTPVRTKLCCAGNVAPPPMTPGLMPPATPEVFGILEQHVQQTALPVQHWGSGAATKVLRLSDHLTSPVVAGTGQQQHVHVGHQVVHGGGQPQIYQQQGVVPLNLSSHNYEYPTVPPLPSSAPLPPVPPQMATLFESVLQIQGALGCPDAGTAVTSSSEDGHCYGTVGPDWGAGLGVLPAPQPPSVSYPSAPLDATHTIDAWGYPQMHVHQQQVHMQMPPQVQLQHALPPQMQVQMPVQMPAPVQHQAQVQQQLPSVSHAPQPLQMQPPSMPQFPPPPLPPPAAATSSAAAAMGVAPPLAMPSSSAAQQLMLVMAQAPLPEMSNATAPAPCYTTPYSAHVVAPPMEQQKVSISVGHFPEPSSTPTTTAGSEQNSVQVDSAASAGEQQLWLS